MPEQSPPDIVLLGAEWQPRGLLRAQLTEDGFEAVATNTSPMMRRHLRPGSKPQLAIVDLRGLPNPTEVLKDLRVDETKPCARADSHWHRAASRR